MRKNDMKNRGSHKNKVNEKKNYEKDDSCIIKLIN